MESRCAGGAEKRKKVGGHLVGRQRAAGDGAEWQKINRAVT